MLSLILLFIFVNRSNSQPVERKCLASKGQGYPTLPCQFPFHMGNLTFTSCTNNRHPEGKYWCSTQTHHNGWHTPGHWGICQSGCFDNNDQSQSIQDTNYESGKYLYNEMDGCGKSLRKFK